MTLHRPIIPPGTIVGYRRDGRPIHPICGAEDGDGQTGNSGSGQPQGGNDGQPSGQNADPGSGGNGAQDSSGSGQQTGQSNIPSGQQQTSQSSQQDHGQAPGKVEDLPDWAQKVIRDTRNEAAGNRTKANDAENKHQGTLDAIAKALGLKDEQPDPAKLAEQLQTSQAEGRQRAVELAVYRTAAKHSADPEALLDSRGFASKVGDLDPNAADFTTKVDTAIQEAVSNNPKLKAAQAATRSGSEFAGGSGENGQRPKSIREALERASA
jgi:hypothetical protein